MGEKEKNWASRILQRSIAKQVTNVVALWIASYSIRHADGGLLGVWNSFNLHQAEPLFFKMIWFAVYKLGFILLSLLVVCYYLSLALLIISFFYQFFNRSKKNKR